MTRPVNSASRKRLAIRTSGKCRLLSPGWNEKTRRALERLIDRGANQNLPVVFDFDNTLVAGDLQEATLAVLVRSGRLTAARISAMLSPSFRLPGKGRRTLLGSTDITEYYEALLSPTVHGDVDPMPMANGYAWAIEILEGLRVTEILAATRKACEQSQSSPPGFIEIAPKKARFLVPTFYPEMVELVAAMVRRKFDVWIVSATNVWGVRCMVQNELNPRLRQHGVRVGLRPDHIIGVSTLMKDRHDHLYKDALLVRKDPGYAALDEKVITPYTLTSRLQYPVPTYSGKVACIFDAIGRAPYLCIGDSPGDMAMLNYSQHRLWIARMEKPDHHEQFSRLMRRNGTHGWLLQATSKGTISGFVRDLEDYGAYKTILPAELCVAARKLSKLSKNLGTA